jgi:uncharacterized protein (TIGR02246 family)
MPAIRKSCAGDASEARAAYHVTVDSAEVTRELASGFAAAWNQHDMAALGRQFHDDATFVSMAGSYMRGRVEIERQHGTVHAGIYRNSTLRLDVDDARELVPGVIVAHLRAEARSDDQAAGEVRKAVLTLVIERRGGPWRIIAAHNTAVATQTG